MVNGGIQWSAMTCIGHRFQLGARNRKRRRTRDRKDVKPICQFNFAFQFIQRNIREMVMSILRRNNDDDDDNDDDECKDDRDN